MRLQATVLIALFAASACDSQIARTPDPADLDGDGVPNDQDLCAGSNTDETANADGCAPSQTDPDGNPLDPPADFDTFIIDANSPTPIAFRTRSDNVTRRADGFAIQGTLLLATPLGHIAILDASVLLETASGDPLAIERVRGTATVPFPALGFLDGIDVQDPVRAELGLDLGANLAHLDAPLKPDRTYLYFAFEAGLSASTGPISITAPGGADAMLVLDAADPMFYVSGSLFGLAALGPVESVGIGMSLHGWLPFEPLQTLADSSAIRPFDGHLYLNGSFPIGRLPLQVDGEAVLDLDADDDGVTAFADPAGGVQFGVNGELAVSVEFLSFFEFGFDLGEATLGAIVSGSGAAAYVSGTLEPDTSWLPEFVPLTPEAHAHVEGLISTDLADSYLRANGEYRLGLSQLGARLGLELSDLVSMSAEISIDAQSGIYARGTTTRSFIPGLNLDGECTIEAQFNDDIDDWFVELSGALEVAGFPLADARARLSSDGLIIEGWLDTGISSVRVSGEVTASGLRLRGEAGVSIDILAGKEVVEVIVDGALCGYQIVRDGALCGWDTITSGAVCGWDTVTSGAVCGWETVTSAAQCGWETFGCWINPLNWGRCSRPASCRIQSTCSVPRTCTDFSAPRSCQDLSQPLSCPHTSVIPDWDYGDFEGAISLEVGTDGISGDVVGRYCTDSVCTNLAGGRLRATPGQPFEACVNIASLGEFCAPF